MIPDGCHETWCLVTPPTLLLESCPYSWRVAPYLPLTFILNEYSSLCSNGNPSKRNISTQTVSFHMLKAYWEDGCHLLAEGMANLRLVVCLPIIALACHRRKHYIHSMQLIYIYMHIYTARIYIYNYIYTRICKLYPAVFGASPVLNLDPFILTSKSQIAISSNFKRLIFVVWYLTEAISEKSFALSCLY